mgnify:CR=1 FL=1
MYCLSRSYSTSFLRALHPAGLYATITLIALSIILTGFNIYQKLGQFGGAGSIVPITGFANSVVSPAIEFQAEGQVFSVSRQSKYASMDLLLRAKEC